MGVKRLSRVCRRIGAEFTSFLKRAIFGSQLADSHSSMQKNRTDKRSRLIQTAAKLAHRQGFRKTTLADIAEEAQVPLGNVYYYFKTKDELAAAVVEHRLKELGKLQQSWEEMDSPKERLCACVQSTAALWE